MLTMVQKTQMIRFGGSPSRFIYLFIWGFTSLSSLYRSYHNGELEGQRKPVHTVGQSSVLLTVDQRQATTSFPT